MAGNKSTDQHTVISRGLDNRNTPDKTKKGFARSMYNMDTNTSGYIEKRKGYQHFREVPIRIQNVVVNGDKVELTLPDSLDASLVEAGPIVVSQYTESGAKSYYFPTYENLSNFTIEGNAFVNVEHGRGYDIGISLLQQGTDSLQFAEYVIPNGIENTDTGGGKFQATFRFSDDGADSEDLFTPIVIDPAIEKSQTSFTKFSFLAPADGATDDVDVDDTAGSFLGAVSSSASSGFLYTTATIPLDTEEFVDAPFPNFKVFCLIDTGSTQETFVPDMVELTTDASTGNRVLEVGFTSTEAASYDILFYTIDDSVNGESCVIQDVIPNGDPNDPGAQVISIPNVSVRYNTTALYRVVPDGVDSIQEEVIPNSIIYDQSTKTLTCTYSMDPAENTQVKFVRFPSTPIVAGIEVENPAQGIWTSAEGLISNGNAGDFDLDKSEVSGTWVHGFSQDDILTINNREQYREIKKIDEWSGKDFNKLIAISQGDLWNDSPETENRQYFPITDVDLQDIQGVSAQVVDTFFGSHTTLGGKNRGVVGSGIVDGEVEALKVNNLKNGTVKVTLKLDNVTEGSINTLVPNRDIMSIRNAEVPEYNGEWEVLSTDEVEGTVVLSVPGLPTYTPCNVSSGTRVRVNTDYLTLASTPSGKVDDKVNFIEGACISSIDEVNNEIWICDVLSGVTIQPAVPLSYRRVTDVLPVKSTDWFVKGDLVPLLGYKRKFKILAIDTEAKTITIDEAVEVTGRSGIVTTIKLDGRLILSRTPTNVVDVNAEQYEDAEANYKVQSAALSNSVFFTNETDPVKKYDGVITQDAGIPNWPIRSNSWITEDATSGLLPNAFTFTDTTWAADVLTCPFTVNMPPLSDLPQVGGRIDINVGGTIYETTLKDYDAAAKEIKLNIDTDLSGSNGSLYIPTSFRYYMRLESVDRNLQVGTGPTTGANETKLTIYSPSTISHKCTVFPSSAAEIDWSRMRIRLFRTLGYPEAGPDQAIFYPVATKRFPELQGFSPSDATASGTVLFEDYKPDQSIDRNSSDRVSVNLKGLELPQAITVPPKSTYMTNNGNKMIYAGVRSNSRLDVGFEDLQGFSLTENSFLRTAICLTRITGAITWQEGGDQRFVFYNTPELASDTLQVQAEDLIHSAVASVGSIVKSEISGDNFIQFGVTLDDTKFGAPDYVQIVGKGEVGRFGVLAGHYRVVAATASSITINIGKQIADELDPVDYVADSLSLIVAAAASGGSYDPTTNNVVVVPLLCRLSSSSITHDQTAISDGYSVPANRLGLDLGRAINDVMREQDFIDKAAMDVASDNLPELGGFCQARWGDTVGYNNLVVEAFDDLTSFAIDYTDHDQTLAKKNVQVFINGYIPKRLQASTDSALEPTIDYTNTVVDITSKPLSFRSRVVLSYDNYPDVVDNPFTLFATESDSIIDVAADDGQVITGISGFFGVSAGEDTSLSSYVLVFKESSIYVVDTTQRTAKKLETWGQGCTLPESIVAVDGRVFFANDTGVYVIDRNLVVEYVGRNIESYWRDSVNKRGDAVGFLDSLNRKYKLSVSVNDGSTTSEAVVYDFIKTPETQEGAWVTYDNINARSWKETTEGVYFGIYESKMFSIRNTGTKTDYRDDSKAIESSWTYGAQSFGDKATRVTLNRVTIYLDGTDGVTDLYPSNSADFDDFVPMDEIDRTETKSIYSIGLSPTDRTLQFYQFKLDHGTKDENLIVTSIDFKLNIENGLGMDQALTNDS